VEVAEHATEGNRNEVRGAPTMEGVAAGE